MTLPVSNEAGEIIAHASAAFYPELRCSRVRAEMMLTCCGIPGCYVLRQSTKTSGSYVLSVLSAGKDTVGSGCSWSMPCHSPG